MDASTLLPICFVALGVAVLAAIVLLGRSAGKRRTPGPLVLDDVTIDGKPGQKAIVFSSLEDLMRMAEEVERAEQGPRRPLLYMFQHVALRQAAFENHPELTRELSEPPRPIHPLLHFRSKAQLLCMDAGLLPEDYDMDEAAAEAESELFEAVKVQPVRRGGYTAHIVTMPAPEHSSEAYLAAIVHKDGEPREYMQPSPSTRYFTLERSSVSDRPLLCEWKPDGSRENYGEGPAPEVGPFADAVFERVGAGR